MEVNILTKLMTQPVDPEYLDVFELNGDNEFSFNFSDKKYKWDDTKQVKFVLSQNLVSLEFNAKNYTNESWVLDNHFTYDQESEILTFTILSNETSEFTSTIVNNPKSLLVLTAILTTVIDGVEEEFKGYSQKLFVIENPINEGQEV